MEVLYRIIVNMTAQAYSGKMLVASPSMDNDEIFSKSVVYIYQQKEDLVLGLVLNKPSKLKISDVYKLKSGEPGLPMPEQVYKGGPVNDQSIILLHENNWNSWTACENILEAINMADAVIILTEWNEYKSIDWGRVSILMRKPAWVFDTRSILNGEVIEKYGLSYWSLGVG